MIAFISDIYEENGIFPFLLIGLLLIFLSFLITVSCLEGTEHCLHAFEFGAYCSDCGEALQEYCSACGKAVENVPFCAYCGHALN